MAFQNIYKQSDWIEQFAEQVPFKIYQFRFNIIRDIPRDNFW